MSVCSKHKSAQAEEIEYSSTEDRLGSPFTLHFHESGTNWMGRPIWCRLRVSDEHAKILILTLSVVNSC